MTGPRDVVCDVLVVGGSLAGCATAIRLAAAGHDVVVVDKRSLDDGHYKQLCTHFLQPHAVPLLDTLGLSELRGRPHAVPTKAVFVTVGGVVDSPGPGYDPARPDSYALNVERRVLDPALRRRAHEVGARFLDGTALEGLVRDDEGWSVELRDAAGPRRARARLVVAADGRRSRVAGLLGNDAVVRPNERAAVFGYFRGIPAPDQDRSVFVRKDGDLACVYPLVGGRTELVLFSHPSRVQGWRGDGHGGELVRYFAALDAAPDMTHATLDSPVLGYTDYPNQVRRPVVGGVPFVGDAVVSLDAMSGTGCGFSLLSADLLASALAGRSWDPDDVAAGLALYASRHDAQIVPHVDGICADSLVGRGEESERRTFGTVCADPGLSADYLRLTGRMTVPAEFQAAFMRAVLSARRRPAATPA